MAGFFFSDQFSKILTIKIKDRHDGIFDQVPRIFVSKVLVAISICMSIAWFNNENLCIPPKGDYDIPKEFIHRACWLKGIYIYPHLSNRVSHAAYYGIPTQLENNGFKATRNGHHMLCKVNARDERCKPMKKEYFNQYKWMPFYIIFLSFMFHFPHFVFQMVNKDLTRIRTLLLNDEVCASDMVHEFFNRHKVRNINKLRIVGNYFVKILHIFNSVSALLIIDSLMYNRFKNYGNEWFRWAQEVDFSDDASPTPLKRFLPEFGICEVTDVRHDMTRSRTDKLTVVCEVSAHVFYQYCFVLIWFMIVLTIVCSVIGLILFAFGHIRKLSKQQKRKRLKGKVYLKYLTFREMEYLDCIAGINLSLYRGITKLINDQCVNDAWGAQQKLTLVNIGGEESVQVDV